MPPEFSVGLEPRFIFGFSKVHYRGLSAEVAAVVGEIEQEGWDPRHVFGEFLAYCRDALHLALGAEPADIELPEETPNSWPPWPRTTGYENLLRLLHQLLGSESTVRRSEAGTLAVEIAWLRAAELPKLTSIEEILAAGTPPPTAPSRHPKKTPAPRRRHPLPKRPLSRSRRPLPFNPETQGSEPEAIETRKRAGARSDSLHASRKAGALARFSQRCDSRDSRLSGGGQPAAPTVGGTSAGVPSFDLRRSASSASTPPPGPVAGQGAGPGQQPPGSWRKAW